MGVRSGSLVEPAGKEGMEADVKAEQAIPEVLEG